MPAPDQILQRARRLAQQLQASISRCPSCSGDQQPTPDCDACTGYGVSFEVEGEAFSADELVARHQGLISTSPPREAEPGERDPST